ncbi:winged helix-turn-helix transcriptional regulator [Kaustia mangrovi]|uniref:Winged helix-turn-helix transcriptional regulator n=1 Tax=Kaustia mangrovi TaxID=2593653 RepID=A0A7S8C3N5_9HYPH|nr:MarR family winged helix-turn-helix transcriptional regulator [Kaustia mangrovi]QPC42774.1 winged helix-turn-helix transcriptional regulator [Kaustia mangrovi]
MTDASHPYAACLCLASRRLARVVTQVYDQALAETGLKITQFSVLCALDYTRGKAVPLAAVAQALDMEPSSLTRALNPLVRDGLVELSHGEDRRQRWGRLTQAGLTRLEAARSCWRRAQDAAASRLGPGEIGRLIDGLNAARQSFEAEATQTTKGSAQ